MNNFNNPEQEDSIDLSKIFRLLLMQSKLIIFVTSIGFMLSVLYYTTAERWFRVNSLVQILPNESANIQQEFTQNFTMGGSYTRDVNSIEQLYKSRSNIISVIKDQSLYWDIEELSFSDRKFIEIDIVENNADRGIDNLSLSLQDDGYSISHDDGTELIQKSYGDISQIDIFSIHISKPDDKHLNKIYEIHFDDFEDIYSSIVSNFTIRSPAQAAYMNMFNTGAVLEINFITEDISRGLAILNTTNNNFIEKSIEIESEQATKALNFIELSIFDYERQLNQRKSQLQSFRSQNRTIDVDLEIKGIIDSLNDLDVKLNEIELEIENSKRNFTESNPIFVSLLNQRETILNQRSIIEDRVESLPVSQQQYIDLFRELETTQSIYNELQNRKLEYSLKEASTLGNMRVVDVAYLESKVSPQLSIVFLSIIASFILALITAVLRGLFFIPISNPAELEDSKVMVPIMGVVGKLDETDEALDNERFSQSVESILVNIESKTKNKDGKGNFIALSSPTAENGKSFISRSIAKKLALLDKKVLLLDSDYKRGDQHKSFGIGKIKAKDFFDLNENDLPKLKHDSGVYVLPRITGLLNSFEFLNNPLFEDKMSMFEREFDYIIIDTAPILSVSDTLVLLSYADIKICVVRHGATTINEIKQSMTLFNQIGSMPDGIIYNCYEKPSSYYGYYGLYGNYSYQYYAKRYLYEVYSYDEKKD